MAAASAGDAAAGGAPAAEVTPCFVGLGANLGEPRRQLAAAVAALAALPASRLLTVSPLYRSAPMGPPDQPDYLNAVAALETDLSPLALLDRLQAIEADAGRVRGQRWGARTLDLDLLLYGARRFSSPRLTVPHPGLGERAFVLVPLGDLCGDEYRLPWGADVGTLKARCPGPAPVRQAAVLGRGGDEASRDRDD